MVVSDDIDQTSTELRIAVHQPQRGNSYGASILATAADQLEAKEGMRLTLERGGFRIVDYCVTASRRR